MGRALRRQVLLAAPAIGSRSRARRVQNLADINLTPPSTTLRWRNRRLDQRPFGIGQMAWITQTAPIGSAAVFGLPHLATPSLDAGAREGTTTDSYDSTTFWI